LNYPYSIFKNNKGRLVIRLPNNKIQMLSRFLYEYFNINEDISSKEIHHKDKNKRNDIINNLLSVTKEEHINIHRGE